MTSKAKQHKAMTLLAGLLMTAGAGYCLDVMESERAGISRFDAGMDVKETIQSREMEGMRLPEPVPAVFQDTEAAQRAGAVREPADNMRRQKFRDLLGELARLSQSRPLDCEERSLRTPAENLSYTLALQEVPQYQDAFFIQFKNPNRSWSSLVAYEGENGYVMGKLEATASGDAEVYRHVFDGFLDDIMDLTVVQGKTAGFVYTKLNPQQVEFYRLACSADAARQ